LWGGSPSQCLGGGSPAGGQFGRHPPSWAIDETRQSRATMDCQPMGCTLVGPGRAPGPALGGASLTRRMHKNKVRLALARRLLVGLYVSHRRGEEFSLDRCLAA